MAASSTARRPRPKLIVLAGLPGTGKSTLARDFAERSGGVWLRVDLIEAAVLASGIPRSFETGLAAYAVARDVARDHLRLGRAVVIDAVNGVEPARTMWRELARECDADRYVVELRCSDPVEHRRRVETRGQPTPPLPAPSWEEVVGREYVPWTEPVLALESEDPPERLVLRILEFVAREPPRP